MKHLESSDGLGGLGQVRLAAARFVAEVRLSALLVAVFKADSQLAHVTAGEHVRDPLDHKRTGLLRIRRARSCKGVRGASAAAVTRW